VAKKIPYNIAKRRSGDIASCYASADKAAKELDWHAEKLSRKLAPILGAGNQRIQTDTELPSTS
jgi:UDP-glucose 4-epimerase